LTTSGERIVVAAGKVASMKSEALATRSARSRTSVAKPATDRAAIAIKKILAPTDFSPASQKALKYALRFAHDFGSELTLLHILEPTVSPAFAGSPAAPAFSEAEMADAEESLRTLVRSVRGAGAAGVRSTIRTGVATHEIVEAAKELDVDLVVIATHGYTGWKHFAIGSTAARVARAAPCPVLVVREKEHDFL
jgi:nucleotide-binding universal stress UspA family protein